MPFRGLALPLAALALGLASVGAAKPATSGPVDSYAQDEASGAHWPVYGRTFSANHYSPLAQIDQGNVARLGLAWSLDLPQTGSLLTSPVEADGVLYFSVGLSVIHAVDARTGRLLWTYDPEVGAVAGLKLRAPQGVRGVAWWQGKIYTATQDGRLIALNARTGRPVWSVQTTQGPDDGRFITGAPMVFRGKVIIGHGGADYTPLRGYVTAYDARTGRKAWRFYTVPGDPSKGPDGEASDGVMPMAAKSWTGAWWRFGGGGTAWNAIAYDPRYNRVYIGTGNGFPWNREVRSPAGGDNLFLSSIVAVDADTGKYVWHYQTNPGETWDYNSVMDIELTDLRIDGRTRPVILHAPKNGFFYVIDRETGKLISAEPFAKVTWASRIDLATGRPVENPEARYTSARGAVVWPSSGGAHGPLPMSYSPQAGLAYIPVNEIGSYFSAAGIDPANWSPADNGVMGYNNGTTPAAPPTPLPMPSFHLIAWNPLAQSKAWSVDLPGFGGGMMSTGGGLLFNGQADGWFKAYAAATGKVLWTFDARAGINSEPITYMLDGKQYVTLLAGYRGILMPSEWGYRNQAKRVLTFVLDGKATLPPRQTYPKQFVDDADFRADPALAARGEGLYHHRRCIDCHGYNLMTSAIAPDLRESAATLSRDAFFEVVHNGAMEAQGMPAFRELAADDVEALRHYIRCVTRMAMNGTQDANARQPPRQ